MVHSRDVDDEFDLDKIDTEMKMEKIRQSASKLTWDGFGQALRRNLMYLFEEKRYVFDAEGRRDVLQALSIMRRNLPVDEKLDLAGKLKAVADSMECGFMSQGGLVTIRGTDLMLELTVDEKEVTSCKISYFGGAAIPCPAAQDLINKDDFSTLRSSIYSMLAVVPTVPNWNDRPACVASLFSLEAWLTRSSGSPSFDKISSLPNGYLRARDGLTPARIYYNVEPSYLVTVGRKTFDPTVDFENLGYMELSVVINEKETEVPVGPIGKDPWSTIRAVHGCFCLRFSAPMMFSHHTWRKMEKLLARASVVRQHINIYKYTSDFSFKDSELVLRTSLPPHFPQHCYSLEADYLKDEQDVIIGEIYVRDIRDLNKIVALVRAQQMHNSLWESFLAMCVERWKGSHSIRMKVHPSAARFEVQFSANGRIVVARFELGSDQEWSAVVEGSDGLSINADIDREVTAMLLRSRSIPCALTRVTAALACRGTPDPAEPDYLDNSVIVSRLTDKVGDAWLAVVHVPPPKAKHTYEVEDDPEPLGLLSSFRELDEPPQSVNQARPEAMARNNRLTSDTSYACAFTDLEAICQIAADADSWEASDNSKSSTPAHIGARMGSGSFSRHESSPAPSRPQGLGAGVGGGGPPPVPGFHQHQLSPLETARLRMTHSVGAAAALGAASASSSCSQDVYDFGGDERSIGSNSPFASPSPHATSFGTVGGYLATSPLTSTRGAPTKRRARARKSANIGDRTMSTDSTSPSAYAFQDMNYGLGTATRKPRGKPPVRRPRGTRKSSVAYTHSDMMDQNRPLLQRSQSDYASLTSFPATPTSDKSASPLVEDDTDDDECDPPPPPKGLLPSASSTATPVAPSSSSSTSYSPFPPPPPSTLAGVLQAPSSLAQQPPTQQQQQQLLQQLQQQQQQQYQYQLPQQQQHHLPPAGQPHQSAAPPPHQSPSTSMISSLPSPSGGGSPSGVASGSAPTRVQPVRKNSLEAVLSAKPKPMVPISVMQAQRRAIVSDLYDDGADSPPPPEERIPMAIPTSASPAFTATNTASPRSVSSPRGGESSNSGDGFSSSSATAAASASAGTSTQSFHATMPEQKKIIVKIPKAPSRGSPSVDQQKAKTIPALPRLDKEKKRKESKERERAGKSKEKSSGDEQRRKRKAEDIKDKERSEKRHKSSNASSSMGDLPSSSAKAVSSSPLLSFSMVKLKNFKIPKREEPKDVAKEKEPATPTTPVPAPFPSPSLSASGAPPFPPAPSSSSSTSASALNKSILKKNSTSSPVPPPLAPPPSSLMTPRQLAGFPPSSGSSGGSGGRKSSAPSMEHRRSLGMPPSAHLAIPANIPLPKGPPPPPPSGPSPIRPPPVAAGAWVRPPTMIPTNLPPPPRSPSPDPNAMQIDDANSPEDSLRIADD